MSDAGGCDKLLLVQAELDGELDAAEAAALAAHRADCPVCRAAAAELTQARRLVAGDLYQPMPEDLRARVIAQMRAARPRRGDDDAPRFAAFLLRWWQSLAGFGLGAGCAAALSLLLLVPREPDIVAQLVTGHIRALQPGHIEDVVSTDKHTVKPWFDGRIDFAPPVKDLVAERFPLRGGRLDYIAGRPVAALVYQRDKHLIDLFIWPAKTAPALPEIAQRQGYNVVHWSDAGMALSAVSDLELGQLREFAEDWRRSP